MPVYNRRNRCTTPISTKFPQKHKRINRESIIFLPLQKSCASTGGVWRKRAGVMDKFADSKYREKEKRYKQDI